MKYVLCAGLHNLFFDLAIVDRNHKIVEKHKCYYDRNKDIANNIYLSYKKYFANYSVTCIGVGISNNISFKDDFLLGVKSFDFTHYNLRQSLYKLFKLEIYIMEETHLAALSNAYKLSCDSLLYVVIDNKISNSFIFDYEAIELENDINLIKNEKLNEKCCKDALKLEFLKNNLDDDYIGGYFFSNDSACKSIIENWSKNLNQFLLKLVKELSVKKIVFAGYLGEYFDNFKDYMSITKKIDCMSITTHRDDTLIGVSHLIFKDN